MARGTWGGRVECGERRAGGEGRSGAAAMCVDDGNWPVNCRVIRAADEASHLLEQLVEGGIGELGENGAGQPIRIRVERPTPRPSSLLKGHTEPEREVVAAAAPTLCGTPGIGGALQQREDARRQRRRGAANRWLHRSSSEGSCARWPWIAASLLSITSLRRGRARISLGDFRITPRGKADLAPLSRPMARARPPDASRSRSAGLTPFAPRPCRLRPTLCRAPRWRRPAPRRLRASTSAPRVI